MKYFSRPYRSSSACLGAALLAAGIALSPAAVTAQSLETPQLVAASVPLIHAKSQGYLGVLVTDMDADAAAKLKLKDTRGALVTLIDHDAPAAQAGIRVNDVLLQLNGQAIENADQFSRMLREIPAGTTVSLVISRDGNTQTIAVELADRKKMEHDVWNRIGDGSDIFPSTPKGMGILASGDSAVPSGFHVPWFGSSLNVGALVEPLTLQMADYLGVQNGLMVKQVARKSDAATAGLKAFDVILKVDAEDIKTVSDWDRALRSNQGKTVQVTILRDKKQQTLSLQVDSKHRKGELENLLPDGSCALMAELQAPVLSPEFAEQMRLQADRLRQQIESQPLISHEQEEALRRQAEAAAQQMRLQAGKLREEMQNRDFKLRQQQLDQLKKQMDEFHKNFKPEGFRIDPKQMQELRRQMQEFSRNFRPQDFQLDRKQMDDMRRQMEEFRRNFKPEDFKIDQKQMNELRQQMEQLKRQMEEMTLPGEGHMV